MSIYRHVPGRKANTFAEKMCDQTFHGGNLSHRSIICARLSPSEASLVFPLVYTDKAAGLVLCVKGNQHRAFELKHNSARKCGLCLLACVCVRPFFLSAEMPHMLPERTLEAPSLQAVRTGCVQHPTDHCLSCL